MKHLSIAALLLFAASAQAGENIKYQSPQKKFEFSLTAQFLVYRGAVGNRFVPINNCNRARIKEFWAKYVAEIRALPEGLSIPLDPQFILNGKIYHLPRTGRNHLGEHMEQEFEIVRVWSGAKCRR
ncbi:MAG: hypothetical protein AB7F86_06940 [Bdellovibrionales bacterium]